ncbi:LLM class flavin-dependent oxidoreductase [Amycolatopsis nigrescens]|uniref:LLM class flavin-dependent oxidoreductase n=1 Tax=Amycolatopsis nigrescens TaxID=381445 RepID=UPI000366CFA7|nr:LLM class flavin-dependent oxidoreductase [Amycolatopsis nigrescens]
MDVGVGLPTMIAGTHRRALIDWAVAADQAGFSTLAVLDRLVYDCWEPLVTLGVAAAVTERINLLSSVLLAPYRTDTAVLAKQAATVNLASAGRLTLGMAVGLREDDYDATGASYPDRGRRLDEMTRRMTAIWAGERVTDSPQPIGPMLAPALAFGGQSEPAVRRAARLGRSWIAGGTSPMRYAKTLAWAREVWEADGRTEEPRNIALCYYAVGEGAEERVRDYLGPYYSFVGEGFASRVISQAVTSTDGLRAAVDRYREAGCDEVLFFPCANELGQLEALAEAAAPSPAGV